MKRKQRHLDLLWMAAHQFRICDAKLVAHDWECLERTAARELDALVASKELVRGTALMRCVPPVDGPLASWEPKQPLPRHGGISKRCRTRWAALPCSERPYFYLSPPAARSYGVERPVIERRKLSHDLGTTACVFYYHRESRERAKHLRSEDAVLHLFSEHGMKRPDLVFLDGQGSVTATAEFASSYDSARVLDYLQFHKRLSIPTEIF